MNPTVETPGFPLSQNGPAELFDPCALVASVHPVTAPYPEPGFAGAKFPFVTKSSAFAAVLKPANTNMPATAITHNRMVPPLEHNLVTLASLESRFGFFVAPHQLLSMVFQ